MNTNAPSLVVVLTECQEVSSRAYGLLGVLERLTTPSHFTAVAFITQFKYAGDMIYSVA